MHQIEENNYIILFKKKNLFKKKKIKITCIRKIKIYVGIIEMRNYML